MKQTFNLFLGVTAAFASIALLTFMFVLPAFASNANWDTTGDYVLTMEYDGSDYDHDTYLTQDSSGNLTGNGGSPAGNNTYLWTITDGTVTGDSISFTADYTSTADAVTPQTTIDVEGTIKSDGTMSGTWSDNYENSSRSGTWTTTSGSATHYAGTDESSTVTVTIDKFINGAMATPETANYADFTMKSTWETENVGSGTGSYTLSKTNTVPYRAITGDMTKGANYETEELLNSNSVGAHCDAGKQFALEGYTYGNSKAAAMTATPSMSKPSFTNLQHDKYVIVWNRDCTTPVQEGQIGGDVIEGDVQLQVTSVKMIKTDATANGSFSDGWKYVFRITAPMDEQKIAMKFNDWLQTDGGGAIPVNNNMRISSLQADNGGAAIYLTSANVYSTPDLYMVGDLTPTKAGRQVEITVDVAVPNGTPNGSYTTSYGVQSH